MALPPLLPAEKLWLRRMPRAWLLTGATSLLACRWR
jgi:hypothetical protein